MIGLNLYTAFLRKDGHAHLSDLIPHIEHFFERGAEHALCFGGDWDGAELPPEIHSIADVTQIAELLLARNYSESLVRNFFFENAYAFCKRYFSA